jgi:hypothetical protein
MVQTGSFPPRKDCLTALLEETIEQAHQSFTLDQVKHVDITRYTPNSMNIRATTDYSGIAANPQDVASFAARECVQVTPRPRVKEGE